jgi:hypothetical protein
VAGNHTGGYVRTTLQAANGLDEEMSNGFLPIFPSPFQKWIRPPPSQKQNPARVILLQLPLKKPYAPVTLSLLEFAIRIASITWRDLIQI